jgi:hypothetical protein
MALDLEYYGVPPADYRITENRTNFTASAGQTVFSAPYAVGYVDVYLNGAHLAESDFTATDGANVTLNAAAVAGDYVQIISRAQVQISSVYTQAQVNALVANYYGVCTGTGDVQVVVTNPSFTAYQDGMVLRVRAVGANLTTTPTIAANGLAAVTIISNNSEGALFGNDFATNNELTLRYVQAVNRFVLIDGATTVQTPAQFDSSHQTASTAFVQRALGNYQSFLQPSASTTLTVAQVGSFVECVGSGAFTLTLPAPSIQGSTFSILNGNPNSVTLSTPSGIFAGIAGGSATFAMTNGMSVVLVADGTNWVIASGAGSAILTSAGYQKFPTGTIVQWGSGNTSTSGTTVTFPVAFPTAVFSVQGSVNSTAASSIVLAMNYPGLSTFACYASSGSPAFTYIAVGH